MSNSFCRERTQRTQREHLISLRSFAAISLFLVAYSLAVAKDATRPPSAWERSVVTVEVARRQFDYYQPWVKRTRKTLKTGVVIGPSQILTTADELFDRTLVRLQKDGRGQWHIGEVSWIDYPANLAVVTSSDTNFWNDLKPTP